MNRNIFKKVGKAVKPELSVVLVDPGFFPIGKDSGTGGQAAAVSGLAA
jgi:hypothetical protein